MRKKSQKKLRSLQTDKAIGDVVLTLRPHPSHPDVWLNDELLRLSLGLFQGNGLKLFYCLRCKFCIPYDALNGHLNYPNHTPSHKNAATRDAFRSLSDYGVVLARPELPTHPLPCMPALPLPVLKDRCSLCPKDNPFGIITSKAQKTRHKQEYHPEIPPGQRIPTDPVYVQNLFPPGYNCYNSPSIQVIYTPGQKLSMSTPREAEEDLIDIMFENMPSSAPLPTMPQSTGFADTNPFLRVTTWAEQVAGLDRNQLIRAVEYPKEAGDLWPLVSACTKLFARQQKRVQKAYPTIRRLWMMDSKSQDIFNPLNPSGFDTYCHRMARLVAFVVRAGDGLAITGEDDRQLHLFLTDDQKQGVCKVLENLGTGGDALVDAIQELLLACFAPANTGHLQDETFNDILQVFCMLASLNRTGQFSEPKNITSPLAQVQYILRSVLFEHALNTAKSSKETADTVYDTIRSTYLCSNKMTPYGGLQSLKAVVWSYANMSTSLSNAQWLDEGYRRASLDSRVIHMDDMQSMGSRLLKDLRYLLYEELMFGIPPKEMGLDLDLPDGSHPTLFDKLSCVDPNYSVFTDQRNAALFADKEKTLLRAFLHNKKACNLFFGGRFDPATMPKSLPHDKMEDWLARWDFFQELLAVTMHVLGGQPARATELLAQLVKNTVHRFRHLYWFNNHFFFVVCMSKVTAITMKDRIIVHGLPEELNRILVATNVLVRPVAAVMVLQVKGQEAAEHQLTHLFSCSGEALTPERFSHRLRAVTEVFLGTPLGIADWRHLSILVMRRYFQLEPTFDPNDPENDQRDLQAGHGSKVARQHYAVEPLEWHLMRDDTVAKYIAISKQVSDWFLSRPGTKEAGQGTHSSNSVVSTVVTGKRKRASDDEDFSEDSGSSSRASEDEYVERKSRKAQGNSHASKPNTRASGAGRKGTK